MQYFQNPALIVSIICKQKLYIEELPSIQKKAKVWLRGRPMTQINITIYVIIYDFIMKEIWSWRAHFFQIPFCNVLTLGIQETRMKHKTTQVTQMPLGELRIPASSKFSISKVLVKCYRSSTEDGISFSLGETEKISWRD